MKEERRAILSLIASGRISAREAERLVAAWSVDRDALWMLAAGLAIVVVQGFSHSPVFGHLAQALEAGRQSGALHTLTLIGKGLGGLL